MSDPIDPRDYGRLETKVEQLVKDMEEMKANVQAMRDLMEQSKGGWKTLVFLGGLASACGAAITWVLTHVKVG